MNPRYPVYVISKGRWESRLTVQYLEKLGIPFYLVVEPTESEQYAAVVKNPGCILELPFHDLGEGSIPARNWVWEHSIERGDARHWILDDNIRGWYRFNHNMKVPVADGTIFRAAEDFTDRYENVAQSGMQYYMFAPRKWKYPAFYLNTRIYSCILNSNTHHEHRWRGRYNEDTDLSLRILKDGWCTVLFNAFLANKMNTLTMKGGNTDELYQDDGRLQMAQSLVDQHPDIVRIYKRWGRYQHLVDYRPFKGNLLMKKEGLDIPQADNNYGMIYQEKNENEIWEEADPAAITARFTGDEKQDTRKRPVGPRGPRSKAPVETSETPDWNKLIIKGAK